jgi:hypothetical protein
MWNGLIGGTSFLLLLGLQRTYGKNDEEVKRQADHDEEKTL